ncbi:RimJ/RimL family protein N-acetyltransferase [Evansella vedderi]|uniref:RimJ/RimL family protein N-acetyltransferase n=1 Tax=Evansella vedderi TaxID=38282 RepID=A0ABT9ZQL5_9BACI|nr:GNAT family N-acetyltransferase [Evansella vedderi]MDQ0253528.1 RimJ/RimL family protein N-acetyltransferase [Evansella vedderi]
MGKVETKKCYMRNGEAFFLRTAFPDDAEKVLEFNKTIICKEPYLITTEEEFKLTVNQQKCFLQKMLEGVSKLAILAEYNGEIVGTLDFHGGQKRRIEHQGSFGMSVKKEFRNQGIGKILLTEFLEWAKNNSKIEKVCLEVVSENSNAVRLYRNSGFHEEGRKKNAIKIDVGKYYDLISMACFVKAK